MTALLRRRDVEARSGKRTSSLYADIQSELFTPGIPIGPRSVAWPADEVDAINRARISGKSEDEIRTLVRKLVRARKAANDDAEPQRRALARR